MQWTRAQRQAIEARGENFLVTAAAGSGKTAVLAERILSLAREGERIDAMLVVTFTRAAAAEMRARILKRLYEEGMAEQALRVERADISTLHGFCARVCRMHFQAAGVDPSFRVAEGAELGVLRAMALEEALTACFESPTPAFARVSACLTQQELAEQTEALYDFLMARPDPWPWLDGALAELDTTPQALRESPWMRVLCEGVAEDARRAAAAYERLVRFARETGIFEDFAQREAAEAEAFRRAAEEGPEALALRGETVFARRPSAKKDMPAEAVSRFAALRDEAKKKLTEAQQRAQRLVGGLEERCEDIGQSGRMLEGLAEAVRAFHERFAVLKEERNLLDFHDLEHCALRALREESVADAARRRYLHVFVDEYQDSSLIQEAILGCVSNGRNLFLVGDVKQSIYRFRLAEPGLFLQKLADYGDRPGGGGRSIALNANFRSHPTVLRCINGVFRRVFCGGAMELTYGPQEELTRGVTQGWRGAPVELHLAGRCDEEDEDAEGADALTPEAREAVRQEAEIIADRIIALRNAPERHYRLSEMVVLLRAARGKAEALTEVLRRRGIAARSDVGEDALGRPETQAVVALLKAIDNLRQDVPLLAALRGPALGLEDSALAAIRTAHPEGPFAEAMLAYAQGEDALAGALRGFIEKIRRWALEAQVMPLDALLRRIYEQTGLYAQAGAMPEGETRQANLRALCEYAAAYQTAQGGGLGGFLRYLERVRSHEGLAAPMLGERDDLVRVMSIHKSKGLEFPIVFVAGLGARFRAPRMESLEKHADLGIAAPLIDPALRAVRPTLAQEAIAAQRRREGIAEEARILYVALTRAESRLILVGTPRSGDEERWDAGDPAGAQCALDWLAPVARDEAGWTLSRHGLRQPLPALPESDRAAEFAGRILQMPMPPLISDSLRALAWTPPAPDARPLKQSVSSLARVQAKEGEREDALRTMEDLPRRPLFLEARGLTPAERGEAIHAFLRAVPLDAQDLQAVCRNLVERGVLSPEQAAALPLGKLRRCMDGPLWQRMRRAETIRREWAFNLRMDDGAACTLLQGVIDCCFLEEGAWVLVDYKSDHVWDVDALLARYAPQLALYARALTQITGLPVREKNLFLLEKETGYILP